jgi:hypothetical protein
MAAYELWLHADAVFEPSCPFNFVTKFELGVWTSSTHPAIQW